MTNKIGTNAIGPSFGDELKTAGLIGLPFSWGADGSFNFWPAMTPAQIAAVQAVYAVHDPNIPSQVVSDPVVTQTQLQAALQAAGIQAAAVSAAISAVKATP